MHKWILPASLMLVAMASTAIAAPKTLNREKRQVIIVTSELSFINYGGTYYLCDNDTPADMTELSKNCVEISKSAFDYALNTTDADVMQMNMNVDKQQPVKTMQTDLVAPSPTKPALKGEPPKSPKQ